ncbi:hypothetical protein [Arcticibacterium luteifluviistationis]|uniref:Lipoprotein n=1 Tax=Arcticibacterium luteifluviistationis TaxID=1784714 RepID=A0A2Z4G7Q6_9BACT|nr:hypothetical protein [Arcticibacterium luteifluviistationis]AWV97211.1 hypothetical protein DJ013_03110 [Arcticibacterium luteifluviistationis]
MKKRALIYLIFFNIFLLSSCKEEVNREITLEEQVLTRIQNDCGFYHDFEPEDVGHISEFKNSVFTVSPFIEGNSVDHFGLYLKLLGEGGISVAFSASVASCYLKEITFALNEKYLISGYGIPYIYKPSEGSPETGSGLLIVNSIEKIE